MKDLINNVLLLGLAALFLYGLFSAGRYVYRGYQDQKARGKVLGRFLTSLPQRGFQRLPPEQNEIRQILDRYYVLRNTKHPILELKATSAFGGRLSSFPAYFLVTYEKISLIGAPIGAGGRSSPSEFQGTVAAVLMPLAISGRTMIYRRPEAGESDHWDWFADTPLLGAHASEIEAGFIPEFGRDFSIRSTSKTVSIPQKIQEFLLKEKALFAGSFSRRSALVADESGWAFVGDGIADEETLKNLMAFQENLTRYFKESGK